MLFLICSTLALAFATPSAEYIEWTSAAVTARPHVKAVIPLNRLSLKCWPIDSLTLNVDMAGSESEIGLNPVLVADLIHSTWCSRTSNGSAIRYLPLNHYVPSPAATWNLNDGRTVLTTKHVTNWVNDICVVIRPLGHDISSKVSASAWTKRMNVEMGVGLDSALQNMLIAMVFTVAVLLGVTIAAVFGFRKSMKSRQMPACTNTTLTQLDGNHKDMGANENDSDQEEDDDDDDQNGYDDDDLDDDYDKQSDHDVESEYGYDDTRSSSPETNGNLFDNGFVDVKSRTENGNCHVHRRRQ